MMQKAISTYGRLTAEDAAIVSNLARYLHYGAANATVEARHSVHSLLTPDVMKQSSHEA